MRLYKICGTRRNNSNNSNNSPKKSRKVTRKKRKGGYSQYMSNQAFTPGVSFTGTNSLQGANSQPFPHSIYNHGEMNSNLIDKSLNSNFSNSNSNSSLSPSNV